MVIENDVWTTLRNRQTVGSLCIDEFDLIIDQRLGDGYPGVLNAFRRRRDLCAA